MTYLPQVNASLRSISPAGYSADYELDAGDPGTPRWFGRVDAYVIEKVKTVYSPNEGALRKLKDLQVIIPSTVDGNPVALKTGDMLNIDFQGENRTVRVLEFGAPVLPGVARYMRVHIEPISAETI